MGSRFFKQMSGTGCRLFRTPATAHFDLGQKSFDVRCGWLPADLPGAADKVHHRKTFMTALRRAAREDQH
jgi:hypothetical protein